jgi:hypothetical protein
MTPSGIEPATFQFVTQHLNHCATAVTHLIALHHLNTICVKDFSMRLLLGENSGPRSNNIMY